MPFWDRSVSPIFSNGDQANPPDLEERYEEFRQEGMEMLRMLMAFEERLESKVRAGLREGAPLESFVPDLDRARLGSKRLRDDFYVLLPRVREPGYQQSDSDVFFNGVRIHERAVADITQHLQAHLEQWRQMSFEAQKYRRLTHSLLTPLRFSVSCRIRSLAAMRKAMLPGEVDVQVQAEEFVPVFTDNIQFLEELKQRINSLGVKNADIIELFRSIDVVTVRLTNAQKILVDGKAITRKDTVALLEDAKGIQDKCQNFVERTDIRMEPPDLWDYIGSALSLDRWKWSAASTETSCNSDVSAQPPALSSGDNLPRRFIDKGDTGGSMSDGTTSPEGRPRSV